MAAEVHPTNQRSLYLVPTLNEGGIFGVLLAGDFYQRPFADAVLTAGLRLGALDFKYQKYRLELTLGLNAESGWSSYLSSGTIVEDNDSEFEGGAGIGYANFFIDYLHIATDDDKKNFLGVSYRWLFANY